MILRILLDQNIPPSVREFIRKRKPHWEVKHVNDIGLHGATDETIFRWAQTDGSIVVTFDEDFADARIYRAGSYTGVVRLRVWPTTVENTEAALTRLLDSVPEEDLQESLVIVGQSKIRIRRSTRHG